ncbi:hypothetical protein [Micromonospora endophytica]|uniref:Uncharacterized protein n=1 Tax=Micromonospora endophytica TaxID=515350 RepID=A0A2W2BT83_9ACTN|nr:hypothetical protein [Micromonospora endophytica]PZF90465.1 hypothetical protein C1I93_22660 [Micromonospora endophytica]RIW48275.1 hypothetical protein D3H59_08085 [Micromonospora endophytica]BCJ56660.1 hypothetical protein Jiend_00820 [Micromonospora endophytica]
MRLTRIIMATMVGLAVVAVPAAAGAAAPQPQPTPTTTPTGPPQPPPYPPGPPSLSVDPATAFVGETVDIIGRNFGPNEIVDIVLIRRPLAGGEGGGALGVPLNAPGGDPDGEEKGGHDGGSYRIHLTARTNSRGDFRIPFTPKWPGIYTITATGRTSGLTASTELRVLPRHKPKPPHHLPVTGSSLETPLKVGGGLVATGTVLLLGTMLWRRRNRFGAGGTH